MGEAAEVGARPRWPEVVITLAILALFAVGVAALFGRSIRDWLGGGAGDEAAAPAGIPGQTGPRL